MVSEGSLQPLDALSGQPAKGSAGARLFRWRLLTAMMLVVSCSTLLAIFFAHRQSSANAEADLQQQFQGALATLHSVQALRQAALAERCRILARRPRIVAALEDNALDLLYPTSADELRDLLAPGPEAPVLLPGQIRVRFFRFLDAHGQVIPPGNQQVAGRLPADAEQQLSLPSLPQAVQSGYLRGRAAAIEEVSEVLALPIYSSETGEPISALVVGFPLTDLATADTPPAMGRGLWLGGEPFLLGGDAIARVTMRGLLSGLVAEAERVEAPRRVEIDGEPFLLLAKLLNAGSAYAPCYELCWYPLRGLLERQSRLSLQILGLGAALLLGALALSHRLSRQLAGPVERLALDSEQDRAQRHRAEAELISTHHELERAARFSADASHQLKTPVTVLRIGLELLQRREDLAEPMREEVESLIQQTYRLGGVIEDLLLLSRMDAGMLQIQFGAVDLGEIIAQWLDDLSVLPDPLGLTVTTAVEPNPAVLGEGRYVRLIVQNLLVNARKYNRAGGRIHVGLSRVEGEVALSIGNTGSPIPPQAQGHIFERFHRGAAGEGVPGHGLGLNLAHDLAQLHSGRGLRLVRSADDWTEFEVRFRPAPGA